METIYDSAHLILDVFSLRVILEVPKKVSAFLISNGIS